MIPTPIVTITARLLLAPAVVVGLALTIKGTGDIGDGFSAGVGVGLAVALGYLVRGPAAVERDLPIIAWSPWLVVVGLALAILAGLGPVLLGDPAFTLYPQPASGAASLGTLKFTTGVVFEIGIFLLVTGVMISFVHHLARATTDPDDGDRPGARTTGDGPATEVTG